MTAERRVFESMTRVGAGLSAPEDVLDRIEGRVMAAFKEAVDEGRIAGRDTQAAATRRPTGTVARRRRARRHAVALGLAATLVLAGSVAVASAETVPGRPLFGVRLAFERALLPSHPGSARIAAQVAVLDRRLAEATDADRDPDAVDDAMRAYRATLHELVTAVRDAPGEASMIERSLLSQVPRIEALESRSTSTVQRAFDGAARDARDVLRTLASPIPLPAGSGSAGPGSLSLFHLRAEPDSMRTGQTDHHTIRLGRMRKQ